MAPPSPEDSTTADQPIPHLLDSLITHAQVMAENLTSLTRHFDMCVTAVRSTEGGAAMALRRAADMRHSQTSAGDQVSISGVMGPRDDSSSQTAGDDEPQSAEERAEAIAVVVQDAPQVDEVVAELQAGSAQMETDFVSLSAQADRIRATYTAAVRSFAALEEVGQRLRGYVAAEGEFLARWNAERESVLQRLDEMDEFKTVYDKYLNAYDSLLLEMERRRGVEDKIQSILRKARDNVQKLVEADQRERDAFRQDIGDFMPTDLWVDMNKPLRRWELVAVGDQEQSKASSSGLNTKIKGSGKRS
jgi:autophagy-related protein 17